MSTSKPTRVFAFIGAMLFFVTSCALTAVVVWQIHQDKKPPIQQIKETKLEGKPLANFTPISKIDKLSSTDTVVGTGQEVKEGDTITAHYTGAVASSGIVFQSSHDTGAPVTFSLSGVIKGWQQGVPGMKVGGTRRLLIPADLAYGPAERPGIPANSDLVFDIELVSIGK